MYININSIDSHLDNIIKTLEFLKRHKETLSEQDKKLVFASHKFRNLIHLVSYLIERESR